MNSIRSSNGSKATRATRNGKGPRPETAAQILDAASGVFTELGYGRATIADIATAAESTRPTVYSYFSSKEDVFRGLAERVREEFGATQRVPGHLPPDQIIRLTDLAYLRAYARNVGLLTIIQHQSLSDPGMTDLWQDIHGRINKTHCHYMQKLVDNGQARPVASIDAVADAVNGIVMRFSQLVAEDPARFDKLGDDLVRIHLAMLGISSGLVEENASAT